MPTQTLNTYNTAYGLSVAGNITTADLDLAAAQSYGDINMGTLSNRNGQITIGGNTSDGTVQVSAGTGGINLTTFVGGQVSVLSTGGGTTKLDSLTTGSIVVGDTQTTGPISIGTNTSRSGAITMGHTTAGVTTVDGSSVEIGAGTGGTRLISSGQINIEETGGNSLNLVTRNGGSILMETLNGGDMWIKGRGTTRFDAGPTNNMIIGGSVNSGHIAMGENQTSGAVRIGNTSSLTRHEFKSGTGGVEMVSTGGDVDLMGTAINVGADASETVININTSASGTGNVNIGNGSGSVGISINSGTTDLVDIGWEGGAVNIANNPTGTLDTLIGNATASGNVEVATAGNINLTAAKVRTLGTAQATTLTNGSAEYKGGIGVTKNIVVGENIILGEDLRADDLTRNLLMFNGNTSGSIAMGGGMTTADISLGAAAQTGQIKILPTAESTTTTTGGLICSGGVGIAKRLELGTDLTLGGDINSRVISRDVTMFGANTTGDISIGPGLTSGELLLGKAAMTGQIKSVSTADATSTVNGGFAIAGGLSVAKRLYCDTGIWLGDSKPTTTQTTSITTGVNTGAQRYGRIDTVVASDITAHIHKEFTWTNSLISTSSIVLFSTVYNSTTNGHPLISLQSQGSGTAVVRIQNVANGTLDASVGINYVIL